MAPIASARHRGRSAGPLGWVLTMTLAGLSTPALAVIDLATLERAGSAVTVTYGHARFNRRTGTLTWVAFVTNRGAAPIPGPVYGVGPDPDTPNLALTGFDDRALGGEAVYLIRPGGEPSPGETVQVRLSRASRTRFRFHFEVYGTPPAPAGPRAISYEYDAAGRLTHALRDGGGLAYRYDENGNLIERTPEPR